MKNNWEKLIFEDVFSIINDKTKQVKSSDYQKIGNYPIIDQSSDFICGFYDDEKKVVKKNLPIVIFGDHTRHVKFIEFPFVCGADGTQLIVPKINLQRKYLYYLILDASIKIGNYGYDRHLKHLKNFTGLVNSNTAQQRKIASILSTCDEVIEKTEAAIAKYEALKQGMMHDLFTRGIDIKTGKLRPSYQDAPELYKESVLGMIPKEWEEGFISDVVEVNSPVTYGIVQPGDFSQNGVLLIRGKDYISGWAQESEFFRVKKELHAQFKRSTTLSGDLLICIVGATYGAVGVVPEWIKEANITQTTARIRCNQKKFIPNFIEYYLKSSFGRLMIEKYVKGSAQPGLNLADVEKFITRYPEDINEQKMIGDRIKSLEKKLKIEQIALAKYQQIKSGLMQDLLTGKVEVSFAEEIVKN